MWKASLRAVRKTRSFFTLDSGSGSLSSVEEKTLLSFGESDASFFFYLFSSLSAAKKEQE